MPVRFALPIVLLCCWDAWRLLAGRVEDAAGALLVAGLAAAMAWQAWRRSGDTVRPSVLAALLLVYGSVSWTGPALAQVGVAVAGLAGLLWPRDRWPVIGLSLLALPVLPTLDFLLAYPLRHISALITAAMLRLNGMAVDVEGVALVWHGQRLLFDGPCSGVRMLWAALLLASLVATVRRLGPLRYLYLLCLAVIAAVAGNALRAASLFYLETGFLAPFEGSVAHELVGIAAFAFLAAALVAAAWRMGGKAA